MRVLDVACGGGAVLVPAARLVDPAGLAVGIDLAAPMAAVAAGKLQRLDQARGVVAVMDASGWACGPAGLTWSAARRRSTFSKTRPRRCAAGGRCCARAGCWRFRSSATWTPAGPGRTSCWNGWGRRWGRWAVGT
jgi:Protein-L-isoaspartate(D-aspartate) O-methyltransferase (PCMT)